MSTAEMSGPATTPLRSALHPPIPETRMLAWARAKLLAVVVRLESRRAESELMELDDRMLKDIGIDRAGIKWAVKTEMRDRRR